MKIFQKETPDTGYSLYEILVYIWRGKIFIGAVVALSLSGFFISYALAERVYVCSAAVNIGKIGNLQLESEVMIRNYIESISDGAEPVIMGVSVARDASSSTGSENDLEGLLTVDIVVESRSAARSRDMCEKLSNTLVERHRKVFTESIGRIKKNTVGYGGSHPALMLLDTYNFQTARKAITPALDHRRVAGRFNIPDSSISLSAALPSLIKLSIMIFAASFMAGTLMWLMIEYLREGDWKRLMKKIRR